MASLFAFLGLGSIGPTELIVLAIIGILLFGRKLPEVGRYLGQSIIQFKKGMKGLEDGVDDQPVSAGTPQAASKPVDQIKAPTRVAATAPKFEDVPANSPQV